MSLPNRKKYPTHLNFDTFEPEDRPFGIEIECYGDILKFRKICEENGANLAPPASTYHEGHRYSSPESWRSGYWEVGMDSSCSVKHGQSTELRSPVFQGDKAFKEIELIFDCLKEAEFGFGRSCGTHIHQFAYDMPVENMPYIIASWVYNRNNLMKLLPEERRSRESYVGPIDLDLQNLMKHGVIKDGKVIKGMNNTYYYYSGLNVDPYYSFGTIEFKTPQTTFDIDNICKWIKITRRFIEAAIANEVIKEYKTLGRFLRACNANIIGEVQNA